MALGCAWCNVREIEVDVDTAVGDHGHECFQDGTGDDACSDVSNDTSIAS